MTQGRANAYFYGESQQTRRPAVMGVRGVVASGHYLASQAGMRILQAGGNATDAGVAAGLCINVLLPFLTNLGGVAPIILYSAKTRRVTTISGLGRWPRAASIDVMKERGNAEIPPGLLRCVTPAALDAWVMALSRYGRLTFAQVAEPALELAEGGFAADSSIAAALANSHERVAGWPSTLKTFYPLGRAPGPGEVIKQPDLAKTFKALMAAESSSSGKTREDRLRAVRDLFYKGDIARQMAEFHRSEGGLMTREDLADFEVREEPPVSISYKGYDVYACGPWCQGPMVPQVLKLLEGVDLAGMGHNNPAYLHHVAEAIKLTYADRDRYYGDPDFVSVPTDSLLSAEYAQVRRPMIDPAKAWPEMPPYGDPRAIAGPQPVGATLAPPKASSGEQEGDTSYVCVVDAEGNGFSVTPSDFMGDVPVVPGLGFIISGRGSQSWLDPEHASSLQPWKRPRLTPNPGLVMRDGELFMVFGTPGGDQQPQGMVQFFLNVTEFGMSPQVAVEQPRVGSESFPGTFWPHAYFPGRLNMEARFPAETQKAMAVLGHQVHPWVAFEPRAGHLCAVLKDRDTGVLHGAADPRFTAYAIAW